MPPGSTPSSNIIDLGVARVKAIEVFPKNPVVPEPGARQQFRVVATFSDGKMRDVTAEAFIESGNQDVATADERGVVTTLRRGEAPVLARFEGSYAATTVTVMGDRTGFAWAEPEKWNKVDEFTAAKWQRMKILPSELCTDDEFIRRVKGLMLWKPFEMHTLMDALTAVAKKR